MRRWLALVGITAGLALGLTVAAPVTAVHAVGSPPPINTLPSTTVGATRGMPAQTEARLIGNLLYKAAQTPTAQAVSSAIRAGDTLDDAQKATAAATKAGFKMPAVPVGAFTRVVAGANAAGVAITGFQLGVSAGNGIATNLLGLDSEGLVCEHVKGQDKFERWFVSTATGTDCASYDATQEYLTAMEGEIVPGISGGKSCYPGVHPTSGVQGQWCIELVKLEMNALDPRYGQRYSYVFSHTFNGNNDVLYYGQGNAEYFDPASNAWYKFSNSLSSQLGQTLTFEAGREIQLRNRINGAAYTKAALSKYRITGTAPAVDAVDADTSPDRTFKCSITATDGAVYSATTASFEQTAKTLPIPDCPTLPVGVFPVNMKIDEEGGLKGVTVWNKDTTPEYKEAVTMPECMDGSCLLILKQGDQSCFDLGYECADWFADPDRATNYACYWGDHLMPLERCTTYAPTFKPTAATTGEHYGHPDTGKPLPSPNPAAEQEAADQAGCFPSGWGVLNPFEWIVKPIKCAMTSLFIPSPGFIDTTFGTVPSLWEGTTPGKYVKGIQDLQFAAPATVGCEGLSVDMSWLQVPDTTTMRFLPACEGDFFAQIAPLFKVFMYGSIAVGGFYGITRHVGNIFGYGGVGGNGDKA